VAARSGILKGAFSAAKQFGLFTSPPSGVTDPFFKLPVKAPVAVITGASGSETKNTDKNGLSHDGPFTIPFRMANRHPQKSTEVLTGIFASAWIASRLMPLYVTIAPMAFAAS